MKASGIHFNGGIDPRRAAMMLCLLLALVTAALYWPMMRHDFVDYDDRHYLLDNPHVSPGLTWSGILWSFQCGYAANWHPLTWISHMIDFSLYGLNPSGHHLTNLLFHVANTLLLFLLLRQMTGSLWRSFFVAAFFGWHPLRVESVAWAAERKDVLCAFFGLLTLWAYGRYAKFKIQNSKFKRETMGWYSAALFFFALGLMSKPMLVTLPFVLLLMDFWPLGRCRFFESGKDPANPEDRDAVSAGLAAENPSDCARRLIREKLPFFALALLASGLTYLAQHSGGAVRSWVELPLSVRIANAVMSYLRYIAKTFWPSDLSAMYPYYKHWPVSLVIAVMLLLGVLSAWFALRARRSPWLIVGWLWYLGTLIPVLGLVQVGSQAMADRYTYLPGIGLLILIVWGVNDLLTSIPWTRKGMALLGTGALAGCLAVTSIQLKYWRDGETLFRHVVAVTRDNYAAYECLGRILDNKGEKEAALKLFVEAVRIEPRDPLAQYNLGTALLARGRLEEATNHFGIALQQDPKFAEPHSNWGKALLDQGKLEEAEAHLSKAVELQPDNAEMRYNLGTLLLMQSRVPEAVAQFTEALRLKPDHPDAHRNLAFALVRLGKPGESISHLSRVAQLQPQNPQAHVHLGQALLEDNRPDEAEAQFSTALRLQPGDAQCQYHLATALIRQRKSKAAVFHYREALRLQPEYPEALDGLAWVLASDPDSAVRAGIEAVQLAEHACRLTRQTQAAYVITLAAGLAESGQFTEAVAATSRARELAVAAGEPEAAARAEALMKLFESRRTVADALK